MSSKTLHLTIKKKWFDMIASGEKKEEYRETSKHWKSRLFSRISDHELCTKFPDGGVAIFRNGRRKDSSTMKVEFYDVDLTSEGKPEWGAEPGMLYFVLKLGRVLEVENG